MFYDHNDLALGTWYRLTEKWSDISRDITYYLQDLDTPGVQTQICKVDKKDYVGVWADGDLASCLSITVGRAVCEAQFSALIVGLEGT